MRRLSYSFALVALLVRGTGCAHEPTVPEALDVIEKAMAGANLALEYKIAAVDTARKIRIEQCRAQNLETEAQRAACMGILARPIEPIMQKTDEAYDLAVEALQIIREAYDELQPILEAAKRLKE